MPGRFNADDYIDVDERIDKFWQDYPEGAIRTEMLYCSEDGSSVAIKAAVFKACAQPHPDATGIAQEYRGGQGANSTSWWENCETSAIGRALANLGMSISRRRPSKQEMQKVERHQHEDIPAARRPTPPPAATTNPFTPEQFGKTMDRVWELLEDGKPYEQLVGYLNAARPSMTAEQKEIARLELPKLKAAIQERAAPAIAG